MSTHSIARPLDPAEAFFFMSDRISCMNFVFFAERSGHLDPARIAVALAVVQHENGSMTDYKRHGALTPLPGACTVDGVAKTKIIMILIAFREQ